MNLNKVFIMGNLTRDPEMRSLPSGNAVASFGVATNRIWRNQSGEKQQDTQFHNIVVFGKQAETASQYLRKGSLVLIEGRIQTRNWTAQDGSKRYTTEIIAERFQLGPRRETGAGGQPARGKNETETLDTIEYPEDNNKPEDIPF